MKTKLRSAQTGRNLLKRKSDAMTIRFRQVLRRIIEAKTLMATVISEAAFSLAEARFTSGDFGQQIMQNVSKSVIRVKSKKENVAGRIQSIDFFQFNLFKFNFFAITN